MCGLFLQKDRWSSVYLCWSVGLSQLWACKKWMYWLRCIWVMDLGGPCMGSRSPRQFWRGEGAFCCEVTALSTVSCAKTDEPIKMWLGMWTRVGLREHVLDVCAHWCHLTNMTEASMCGGDAALCQITLTTCCCLIPSWVDVTVYRRPSYALQSIKKKIENENPHVAKFALQVRMKLIIMTNF